MVLKFRCFLQAPFLIYMGFTCFLQYRLPFLCTWCLHVSYGLPFSFTLFDMFLTGPFFHLLCFHMFLIGFLVSLLWFLRVHYSLSFLIYMVYTRSYRLPFNFSFKIPWFIFFSLRLGFYLHGFSALQRKHFQAFYSIWLHYLRI